MKETHSFLKSAQYKHVSDPEWDEYRNVRDKVWLKLQFYRTKDQQLNFKKLIDP